MSERQSRHPSVVLTAAGLRLDTLLRQAFLVLLAGAYLVGQVGWEWTSAFVWPLAAAILAGANVLTWRTSGWRPVVLLCLLCAAFAAGRVAVRQVHAPDFPVHHLRHLALPKKVILEGWLYREPERSPTRGRLHLEVERVLQDGKLRPAVGKVHVTVRNLKSDWQYGDRLRLTAKLRPPRNFHTPGSFDHVGYLARRGIYVTAFLWNDEDIEKIGEGGGGSSIGSNVSAGESVTFSTSSLRPPPRPSCAPSSSATRAISIRKSGTIFSASAPRMCWRFRASTSGPSPSSRIRYGGGCSDEVTIC